MVISGLTSKNTKATLKCCYAHTAMWWLSSAMINYLHNSIHPPEMEINPPEMAHRWWGYKKTLTYKQPSHPVECICQLTASHTGWPQSVQLVNTTAKTFQKQHYTFRVHWLEKQHCTLRAHQRKEQHCTFRAHWLKKQHCTFRVHGRKKQHCTSRAHWLKK